MWRQPQIKRWSRSKLSLSNQTKPTKQNLPYRPKPNKPTKQNLSIPNASKWQNHSIKIKFISYVANKTNLVNQRKYRSYLTAQPQLVSISRLGIYYIWVLPIFRHFLYYIKTSPIFRHSLYSGIPFTEAAFIYHRHYP